MKKKLLLILLTCALSVCFVGCGSESDEPTRSGDEEKTKEDSSNNNPPKDEEKTYSIGETWTVDGQWALTINSISLTDERNEFEERTPNQVFIIDYVYENLGFEDETGFMDGVFFDLSMCQIVDSNGSMGYSYPGNITYYPQETPIGANCQSQACIGVDNESTEIKLIVSEYDGSGNEHKATFIIPI